MKLKQFLKTMKPNKPFYIECDGCVLDYGKHLTGVKVVKTQCYLTIGYAVN